MNRRFPILLCIFALILVLLSGPTTTPTFAHPTGGSGGSGARRIAQLEIDTVNEINNRRAALGLAPLRLNSALTQAARRHSNDMGSHRLCGHTGTDGSTLWDRTASAGYGGTAWSEVIGCFYPASAAAVVDGWWNSPAHFGILTMTNINDIGCGWYLIDRNLGTATCDVGVGP